jgi:hypothetical protein
MRFSLVLRAAAGDEIDAEHFFTGDSAFVFFIYSRPTGMELKLVQENIPIKSGNFPDWRCRLRAPRRQTGHKALADDYPLVR